MQWFFQEHDGFGDIEQSSSSEAFLSGSIKDLATALVREGIQNALDAKDTNSPEPVEVRITLGTCPGDPRTLNQRWFGSLFDHLAFPDVGSPDAPNRYEWCRYLAFEDFNTKGLVGDHRAPYRPGDENNFVNFLYHDGITGKSDRKLGSKGIGKIVFTMASRIRTVLAYTIPIAQPYPILVGKNTLRFRQVSGKLYGPRAYLLQDWPKDRAREPIVLQQTINEFRLAFPIARTNESGLSLVIPFVDPSITAEQLKNAVIQEYFYAILSGKLIVEIHENTNEIIAADTITQLSPSSMQEMVELTRWALTHSNLIEIEAPPPDLPQLFDEGLVVKSDLDRARIEIGNGRIVGFKVNVHIHPKQSAAQKSSFNVYLMPSQGESIRPTYIRELLPVSDIRDAKSVSRYVTLVLIPPGPLADFLRSAEGANHTDWSARTDRFQERFRGRLGEIRFVVTAPNKIADLLSTDADETIDGIASQFFSAIIENSERGKNKPKRGNGPTPPTSPDDIEPMDQKPFLVEKCEGGFVLRQNPLRLEIENVPKRLRVRVAYDVISGSPWSRYEEADFDFRKSKNIRVVPTNAVLEMTGGNKFSVVEITQGFVIEAHGFDPNRDLIVDVVETAPLHETSHDS